MAIEIISGFDLKKNALLDEGRGKVADEAARLALKWVALGLLVYQEDTKETFQYQGTPPSNVAADWVLFTAAGPAGPAGQDGNDGVDGDKYESPSTSSLSIPTTHPTTVNLNLNSGLAYSPGQPILIANTPSAYFLATVTSYDKGTGALVAESTSNVGSGGPFTAWAVNLAGTSGIQGKALLHIDEDINPFNEAKITAVEAGSWTPQNPWTGSVANDTRTNKALPAPLNGSMVDHSVGYDGVTWFDNGVWKGPKGSKGDTGAKGDKGDTGNPGPVGAQGPTGATGPQGGIGPQGPTGATGATGPKGDKGDKGDPGVDGADGDILRVRVLASTSTYNIVLGQQSQPYRLEIDAGSVTTNIVFPSGITDLFLQEIIIQGIFQGTPKSIKVTGNSTNFRATFLQGVKTTFKLEDYAFADRVANDPIAYGVFRFIPFSTGSWGVFGGVAKLKTVALNGIITIGSNTSIQILESDGASYTVSPFVVFGNRTVGSCILQRNGSKLPSTAVVHVTADSGSGIINAGYASVNGVIGRNNVTNAAGSDGKVFITVYL